jgi:hypothetical protein
LGPPRTAVVCLDAVAADRPPRSYPQAGKEFLTLGDGSATVEA